MLLLKNLHKVLNLNQFLNIQIERIDKIVSPAPILSIALNSNAGEL